MSTNITRNSDSALPRQSLRTGIPLQISVNRLFETSVWIVLAVAAFYNLSSLNPDKENVGVDKFVLIKLAVTGLAGLIGLYGAIAIPRVVHLLTTRPGVWLTGIATMFAVSSLFSMKPVVSLASSVSLWCILLFTVTAVVVIGPMQTVKAIVAGMMMFVLASWFVYFVKPSLGVFAEPLAEGQFAIRMSGIAHPNVLGQYAACGGGLIVTLLLTRNLRSKWLIGFVFICLGALAFSISRSSTMALLIATVFVTRHRIYQFFGPFVVLICGMVVVGSLLVASTQMDFQRIVSDRLLAPLSKSGDTEEITSMTGRTEIWKYATIRLQEKPWTGFGPATSKDILKDYSSYTHNFWLNIAFCGGIIAFGSAIFLTFGRFFDALVSPHPVIDFIIIFIFANGLFENVAFSFIPSAPTMLLVVATLWRANQSISDREAESSS